MTNPKNLKLPGSLESLKIALAKKRIQTLMRRKLTKWNSFRRSHAHANANAIYKIRAHLPAGLSATYQQASYQ